MVSLPHCSGPMVRQHIMVGTCDRTKLSTSQAREQRERRGKDPTILSEGIPPMT